jgi:malate dehydrogenase
MPQTPIKVLVTGAAGQIAYALLFRIASGQMFGEQTPIELHLLELESSLPALEGVVMELEDCVFPLLKKIVWTSDLKTAMQGVHWALLVGAAPRKAGMERADLLARNGQIFATQAQALNTYADATVRILVVGNPCNSNAWIAYHHAPAIPPGRFYAMTLLDQHRAVWQLAKKAGVSVEAVRRLAIWGNHSATQYPDFYQATIQGEPVTAVIKDQLWLTQITEPTCFIPSVQQRGAAVIRARGSSSAASAAHAIIGTVRGLIQETPSDDWFSVACYSRGEYGIDQGLIFSYPCQLKQGQLQIVSAIQHNVFAQNKIQLSLEELRQECQLIKDLGLI